MELIANTTSRTAPGCYGAPSVFARDSQICQGCPAFQECSVTCMENLQRLRERVNIEGILAKHREVQAATIESAKPLPEVRIDIAKFLPAAKVPTVKVEPKKEVKPQPKVSTETITPEQERLLAALNDKPRALASKWCRDGTINRIHADLLQGINSFASQARQNFEFVTCDLLLNGAVTKHDLKKAFMARLGSKRPWDERTAASHVNIALQALEGFGIITATDKGYVVTPKTGVDNA